MAQYGFFCTEFLLNQHCDRAEQCIFRHAINADVKLDEPLPNGSDFVKGYCLNSAGQHLRTKNRVTDASARPNYSRMPCYYNKDKHCPYENSCLYSHSGMFWDKRNRHDIESDSKSDPSTSTNYQKCSASTSNITNNSASGDDESCLGATALITSPDKKLESENLKNLVSNTRILNINAPEFVPRTRFNLTNNSEKRLCPFAERDGLCKYPPGECTYLHGDMCDLCTRPALHPYNEELRKKHTQECIRRHERDMEIAFAVARSKEKICGICFEVVMQKSEDEQRFGILPSCNHCFCLACIRRWRQSKQFENKIIRSCPECRIPSDFVCPSAYWVDTKEDKEKVIEKYKSALAKKDCKYFKQGRGHCPFGNKCFYRHCLNNGKKVDVGPPTSSLNVNNSDAMFPAEVELLQRLIMLERVRDVCPLDEFPDDMEFDDILHMLDISDVLFSDTDESYWSD